MLVEGWRAGASSIEAVQAIHKHTGFTLQKSRELVKQINSGQVVKLPDDFVLREDLKDAGFIVS